MDDGLKQRIVGAFVLLVLAIIFVPVVFNRERIEPLDRKTLIPPTPAIEPVIIAAPEAEGEDIEPAETIEEIFLPDETKIVTSTPAPSQITSKPSAEKLEDDQELTSQTATNETNENIEQNQEEPKLTSGKTDGILSNKGVPQGWVLQVASYQSAFRAVAMRDELLGEGYSAYIRSVTSAGSKMSRVYVGPKLDKKKLDIEKATIEQKYGIKTLMLVFEP